VIFKLLLILIIGLALEAIGVVYLSKGLKEVGEFQKVSTAEIIRIVKKGATNPNILLGVLFEALFFGCLLILMSKGGAVSFIWPLTALGFVFTTLAAKFILREEVSALRWGGVLMIVLGAGLITYSEKLQEAKKQSATTPAVDSANSTNQ
jgi:drug/metabolite transporter (DMT)-like permease